MLWRADLSKGLDAFVVEKAEGADGTVTVEGGALRIVKTNARGYIAVRAKEPFAVPCGTELQAFAYVSGARNDPEYALGFLRMYGARKSYFYFSGLDGRGPGGPRMDHLFNTPPGADERKLCRFLADAKSGTNVTAAICVAGAPSDSTWRGWGVEDLKDAKARWREFLGKVEPPDHSADRQDEATFDAALAADRDHTAKVVRRNGTATLLVDGVDAPPVLFKGKSPQGAKGRNLYCGRRMEESGVKLQVITVRFGDCPQAHGWWTPKGFDVQGAVREVKDAMRMAPGSLFVLTAILDAYPAFSAEHPEEVWKAEGGRTVWGQQVHADFDTSPDKPRKGHWPWISYSSTVWREAVRTNLVALIDALKASGLSRRIVGVHLGGYHDHQCSTRRIDLSRPAVEGFRRWQARTFGKVRWPDAPEFGDADYLLPGRDDHQIAYLRYLKRQPFELQEDLMRTAKARFGKDVIGIRWCMAAFGGTYGSAYDITPFTRSDAIDAIAPQADYARRTPGAAIGQRMPCASFREHGKLMLCEFDLRTYGAVSGGETELRVTGLSQATDDAMWRTVYRKCAGQMLAARMGWWFYDMAGGWFEPPPIAADIADSMRTVRALAAAPQESVASAAMVIDEDGMLLRNTAAHWYNHDEERLVGTQLQLLAASGLPYDIWLMDDLMRSPARAERYRTLVFAGMYHVDAPRRRLLDSLKGGGRTLVFLSGTGAAGGADATGFGVIHEPAPRSHRTVAEPGVDLNVASFTDHSLLTRYLGATQLGKGWQPRRDTVREALGVRVLARFEKDGEPALAERAHGAGAAAWKGVYVCSAAGLTPQHFNAIVRGSGGYVPAPYGLQVDMNSSFLSVHAVIPGRYTFRLPRPCRVTNLKTGRAVAAPGGVLPLDLTAGETRWYGLR